jgi:hypothetical protein
LRNEPGFKFVIFHRFITARLESHHIKRSVWWVVYHFPPFLCLRSALPVSPPSRHGNPDLFGPCQYNTLSCDLSVCPWVSHSKVTTCSRTFEQFLGRLNILVP